MKSLIRNYINLLTIEKLEEFGIKNDIHLSNDELKFLLNLVKEHYEDIMKDDSKYLSILEKNINPNEFVKVKELYLYYKNRYKGYLF